MDLAALIAARVEADPAAAPSLDPRASERALLDAVPSPLDARWIGEAARAIAAHHAAGRGAWPLLRVLEPALADLEVRDPESAGRAHAALGAQALLEDDPEIFLDRVGLAADALDRAGAARAACVERAAHGAALLALGMNEQAEPAIEGALRAAEALGLERARAWAEALHARLAARMAGARTNLAGASTWLAGGAAPAWLSQADARAAAGDAAGSAAALAEARRAVLAFASRLRRPAVRKSYLERVPEHRRALSLD